MRGQILAFTEKVAAELAAECRDRPDHELQVWISVALQREAMVTKLYNVDVIARRLGETPAGTVSDVFRKAIGNLWIHEETHTRYLHALKRSAAVSGSLVEIVRGRLEGQITDSATRGGLLGRLGIALGIATGMAPDFLKELGAMSLRDFCFFCAELEQTAYLGYERVVQLIKASRDAGQIDDYALSIREDILRILSEERYHAAVFETITGWLEADGNTMRALSPQDCVRELYRLCDNLLAAGSVRTRGAGIDGASAGFPHDGNGWVSDGGMGPLFLEYRFPVRVG